MSARLRELGRQREQLVARSTAERERLGQATGKLAREIALVDALLGAVRQLRRYRTPIGIAAGAVLMFAPRTALRWVPRLLWIAPVALEGYRIVRALRTTSARVRMPIEEDGAGFLPPMP